MLDPEIGVATADVRLEGFTDEALNYLDFGDAWHDVEFSGDLPTIFEILDATWPDEQMSALDPERTNF